MLNIISGEQGMPDAGKLCSWPWVAALRTVNHIDTLVSLLHMCCNLKSGY